MFLFGSRTDPEARGGDIDLLVRLDRPLDEAARFRFYSEACQRHLAVLERNLRRLADRLPLTAETVDALLGTDEGLWMLDQIAYRYLKLQDTLGKLVRAFFTLKGEAVERLRRDAV